MVVDAIETEAPLDMAPMPGQKAYWRKSGERGGKERRKGGTDRDTSLKKWIARGREGEGGKEGGVEGMYHLDLGQGLGAVLHQVLYFAGVNADHAKEEVAGDAEGEGDGGMDNGVWREGGGEGGKGAGDRR